MKGVRAVGVALLGITALVSGVALATWLLLGAPEPGELAAGRGGEGSLAATVPAPTADLPGDGEPGHLEPGHHDPDDGGKGTRDASDGDADDHDPGDRDSSDRDAESLVSGQGASGGRRLDDGAADAPTSPAGMAPAPEVLVRVVDQDGRPVDGAVVSVGETTRTTDRDRVTFKTDRQGLVVVRPRPRDRTLWASLDGHGSSGWTGLVQDGVPLTEIEAVLRPHAELVIRVPPDDKNRGRRVALDFTRKATWRPRNVPTSGFMGSVTADVRRVVDAPAQGLAQLVYRSEVVGEAPFRALPGEKVVVHLGVSPTWISGTVRGPDGLPAAGATVTASLTGRGPDFRFTDLTDAQGEFVLRPRAHGRYRVVAQTEDLVSERVTQVTLNGRRRDVQLDLELTPPTPISGRVAWPDGRPVPHADVTLTPLHVVEPELRAALGSGTVVADAQGAFTFPRAHPTRPYRITAGTPSMVHHGIARSVPPGSADALVEVPGDLTYGVTVQGTVRNTSGQVPPGVSVTLHLDTTPYEGTEVLGSATPETDGDFAFSGLPAWSCLFLEANAPGYPELRTANFVPGAGGRQVELVLGAGRLEVDLVDPLGRPLSDVGLKLQRADPHSALMKTMPRVARSVETDAQGHAFWRGLAPGSYWLTSRLRRIPGEGTFSRLPPLRVDVAPGETTTVTSRAITTWDTGNLEARVVLETGEPAVGVVLDVSNSPDSSATTDEAGVARWRDLQMGVHPIRQHLESPGAAYTLATGAHHVVITPGQDSKVELVVRQGDWP